MNTHIINCNEDLFLSQYIQEGYIGVGLVLNSMSAQGLSKACRNAYSMFADMKTVFPGDQIFVHAGENIYGIYKAESVFKEIPTVPAHYLSGQTYYKTNPNIPGSGWRSLVDTAFPSTVPHDFRQLSISNYVDNNGVNLCFEKGFNANEVFELRRKRKIWSIPERWKYPDSARTIRPIMPAEGTELLNLLERENIENSKRLFIVPKSLSGLSNISLPLNPNIVENEKLLEAWLCENMKHPALNQIFGNITSYGNNFQMGYLQGIDILGYCKGVSGINKFKVIELKLESFDLRNNRDFALNCIKQVLLYVDWITEHLASGDHRSVDGFIVARGFDQSFIDFVQSHNTINRGRQIRLVRFKYIPPSYNDLCLGLVL